MASARIRDVDGRMMRGIDLLALDERLPDVLAGDEDRLLVRVQVHQVDAPADS
jgi:hypothetical protein